MSSEDTLVLWGFGLSLAAVVLMYPVGVLVNLTSPKVRRWHEARSIDRTAARIEVLQERLTRLKHFESGPPIQWATLRACFLIAYQLGIGIQFLLGMVWYSHRASVDSLVFLGAFFINLGVVATVFWKLRRHMIRHSPVYRMKLAEELYDAEQRLRDLYAQQYKSTGGPPA